jgi:hypothetical protein
MTLTEKQTIVSTSNGKGGLRPAVLTFCKTCVRAVHRTFSRSSLTIGLAALTAWFMLFGLGVLVDSKPFRLVNDPSFQQEVLSEAANAKLPASESLLVKEAKKLSMGGVHAKKALRSFFLALCTYTPINLGMLCFWAGMLGGSASNAAYRRLQTLGRMPPETAGDTRRSEALVITSETHAGTGLANPVGDIHRMQNLMQDTGIPQAASPTGSSNGKGQEADLKAHPAEAPVKPTSDVRAFYLGEHPIAAAIRSFVVYLTLLAGFYLASGDPFKNIDANQYLRLAGIVSCLAFGIGYDPSRFTEILNSLPKPGGSRA